jgi:hypothetical protein
MKICVIGNSHAAALKTAFDSAGRSINTAVDFFALVGRDQPQLNVEAGRLRRVSAFGETLTTVAGAAENGLDIAPYDGLVISACGCFAARNEFIAADPQLHPLGCLYCADWIADDPDRPPVAAQLVSAAVFSAAVEGYVRNHASITLAFLLSEHFQGPVWLQPWPAPSRALKGDSAWFINARYGPLGPRAWFAFFKAQWLALETVAKELGPRFKLLDYPLPGPSYDGFMDAQVCGRDPWHGNVGYGGLVLDQFTAH